MDVALIYVQGIVYSEILAHAQKRISLHRTITLTYLNVISKRKTVTIVKETIFR